MTLRDIVEKIKLVITDWLERIGDPISQILDLKIGEQLFYIDFTDRLIVYPIWGIVMAIILAIANKEFRKIKIFSYQAVILMLGNGFLLEVLYWIVFAFFWIATQPIAK